MAGAESPQFTADGNIAPMSFVTPTSVSGDNRALLAGAGSKIIGISQPAQHNAPWGPLQDGYVAKQGETFRCYGLGEQCWLVAGGTVAVGNRLKSDSSAHGIPVTTAGDEYGAIALEAGVTGQQIRVQANYGQTYTGS